MKGIQEASWRETIHFLNSLYTGDIIYIVISTVVGVLLIQAVSNWLGKLCEKNISRHMGLLVRNFVFYAGLVVLAITILHKLGVNVTALLGAAGILGIAIGIASQTSISNIISGIFLLIERPFSIGDIIKTGDVSGVVESIDLLSIRVRSLDNKMYRISNENVLKNTLYNFTFYPHKRMDYTLILSAKEDFSAMKHVIQDVMTYNKYVLKDPAPIVMVDKIDYENNEFKTYLIMQVWVNTEKWSKAREALISEIKQAFDKKNIGITIKHTNV